jgi:hypothetical protein
LPSGSEDRRYVVAAALVSFAVFSFFFAGHYAVRDNMHRIAWSKALLDSGSHDISPYVPEAERSIYGVGQTLLHIPFVAFSRFLEARLGLAVEMPLNMTLYLLNGVAGVVVFYWFLRRHGRSSREAFSGSMIAGLATIWLPYTKVEHGEPIIVTLLLAAWLLASRAPVTAGLLGGLTLTIRIDSLLWLALAVIISETTWKEKFRIGLGIVPGLALTLWSNWVRTGSPLSSGYQPDFVNPMLVGIYGQLFSAGKSVFLFAPLLLLFFPAVRELFRKPPTRRLAFWAVSLFAAQILFYSRWWAWGGEDAWGPRFLLPAMMVGQLVVLLSSFWNRRLLVALVTLSLGIHLLAAIIGPHTSLITGYLRQPMKSDITLVREQKTPITYDDIRFNPKYSQITQTWQLFALRIFGLRIEYADNTHIGTPFTLVGSSWIESFDPPLRREEVPIDLLWYQVLVKN